MRRVESAAPTAPGRRQPVEPPLEPREGRRPGSARAPGRGRPSSAPPCATSHPNRCAATESASTGRRAEQLPTQCRPVQRQPAPSSSPLTGSEMRELESGRPGVLPLAKTALVSSVRSRRRPRQSLPAAAGQDPSVVTRVAVPRVVDLDLPAAGAGLPAESGPAAAGSRSRGRSTTLRYATVRDTEARRGPTQASAPTVAG